MNYTIKLSKNKKFLEVKVKGQINKDIARQWSADVAKKSRELDIRSFLFDVRSAQNVATVMEQYTFAYQDSEELNLPKKDVRSAILISETDRSHNFVETTFKNAGYDVRLFTDKLSAVKWLEEGSR